MKTDDEIYELCQTEEGILAYIREANEDFKGCYDWVYLDEKKAPLLINLVFSGVLIRRDAPDAIINGSVYKLAEKGREK